MEISKRQLQENYNPSDFNNIPELSQIGTEEQYSAYLDTIFPSSKINQIMYHKTSAEKFDEFKVSRLGGVYFSFFDVPTRAGFIGKMIAKLTKERMVLAKVNVINPFIINRNNYKDIEKKTGGATQSVTELGKKYDLSGYDSILGYPNPLYDKGELDKFPQINFIEGRRKDLIELAVFNPKNIHILGSKQDIEGFRNFVNNTDMEITKRQLQENLNNVIYTAVFFNTNEVVSKYKQIHPNLYSHHSTIEFKPTDISNLPIGEEINIKVIGRLTNDKVDVLLVKNPLSKNKFPHITLSTAEGIKPFQSNTEIENNQDKIKPINDNLIGIVGYFDGRNEVTEKQTKLEGMEITKRQLQDEEVTAYHGGPHTFDKFSTQYMGTGEGNQSFGWGLYFTDLEDIAMNYAFKLSKLSAMDKIFKELKMDDMSFRTREIMYEYSPDHARGEWLIEALDNNYYEEFRKEELNQLRKFAEYKIKKGNKLGLEGYIYKVSLHKGKTPEQYTWLEWDKPVPEKVMNTLGKKLIHNGNFLKDLFDNSREYEKTDGTKVKGLYPDGLMFYKRISQILGGDKEASLFLLKNGIDGIKYPADSLSRGATSYNTSGFNYVVFDENAVNIEKQTQLEGMKISKKELIQNKKLKEDAEDVNFMGEITKGELEEAKKARTKLRKKKKADRCLRIARKRIPKSSAYRSANIVRCRQGDIWTDLKEEETTKGKIHFEHEHLDHYSGQDNYELGIYEDDEVIGYVQYVIFENEITVSDILVRPNRRRENFGSMLIKKMKQLHPNAKYKPSMKTDLGSKFIHKDVKIDENEKIDREKLSREMIKKAHDAITRKKGKEYAPDVHELQAWIDDYIKTHNIELNEKTDFSKEKEQGLHGWFARQGGKGKSKGWVDCNTCRDGKCKSCGRKEGESRAKYPACRPTPSACKTKGKGKSWGKKSTNEDVLNEQSKQDIERELKLNEIKSLFKRHIGKL